MFYKVFRSITVDNGVEFSDYEGMERSALKEEKRTLYFTATRIAVGSVARMKITIGLYAGIYQRE